MGYYFSKFMVPGNLQELCHICRINGLGVSTSWIPGKKGKGIAAVFYSLTAHGCIALGGGSVISYIQHILILSAANFLIKFQRIPFSFCNYQILSAKVCR